ncbi:MAG TPA: hypothetical protein VHQ02_09170 [Usitatibacter sp.]|jgi:hypothetical protein|nr:hypothetical protein [Usitatibacter sp.]
MLARLAAALLVAFAGAAFAADEAAWPPPEPVQSRMRELQALIRSPGSTMAEREAAREELAGLLKSPAGRDRTTPEEARKVPAARAAIEPYPSVVKPLPPVATTNPPPAGVAHLEVVPALKPPAVNPRTGAPALPSGRFAVDPSTGGVLHEVPGGYVDPRTGQFVPR